MFKSSPPCFSGLPVGSQPRHSTKAVSLVRAWRSSVSGVGRGLQGDSESCSTTSVAKWPSDPGELQSPPNSQFNGLVQGKIYRKPWFLPSNINIGVSCKFSHHPILIQFYEQLIGWSWKILNGILGKKLIRIINYMKSCFMAQKAG